MKGIIFNLLEETISAEFGAETWDRLLDDAKLDGVYTSLGHYPDEDLIKLVGAASTALNMSPHAVVRWFGGRAMPILAKKYPQFFQRSSTREFILTLNNIIHPEVRKSYPGATPPDFDFDTSSPDVLVMIYRSQRKFCALAEGLIDGAANEFNETVHIHHPQCMLRGDEACRLELTFARKNPA